MLRTVRAVKTTKILRIAFLLSPQSENSEQSTDVPIFVHETESHALSPDTTSLRLEKDKTKIQKRGCLRVRRGIK
jgi:hypothetical protein